jgi:osmotically-inducible protein OsmY
MYLFDPQQGRRRRALVRDKATSWTGRTANRARQKGRYLGNKAYGVAAAMRSRMSGEQPTDEQLCARVRSEMGRWIGDAGSIDVHASNGHVTLRGPIAPGQREQFIANVVIQDQPGGTLGTESIPNRM